VGDPAALAGWLASIPGVVEHGLFPPEMVATVLVGRGKSVEQTDIEPGVRVSDRVPPPGGSSVDADIHEKVRTRK
jgi:hypothetical protein